MPNRNLQSTGSTAGRTGGHSYFAIRCDRTSPKSSPRISFEGDNDLMGPTLSMLRTLAAAGSGMIGESRTTAVGGTGTGGTGGTAPGAGTTRPHRPHRSAKQLEADKRRRATQLAKSKAQGAATGASR